jgi:spore maturation protein CgeB
MPAFDIVFLGLSVTSSWGNGHATTYRALLRALAARGHRVLFLERDVPWYAQARDLPASPDFEIALYQGLDDLADRYGDRVRGADVVVLGSYVPEGRAVADWVLATARGCRAF